MTTIRKLKTNASLHLSDNLMTTYKKLFFSIAVFLGILFTQSASSESSVWKVISGDNHIYIGGTVHLLSESDHPLPQEFDLAYQDSQILIFETDMASSGTPEFQAKLMQALTYQDGRTLESTLPKVTYKKLDAFFKSRGGNVAQFAVFTPSGIGLMMVVMEYQRIGLLPQWGVDVTMNSKAVIDGKKIDMLETPEQQISFIANLGKGKEQEMIEYTLRDIERLPEYFDGLKQAWRKGDLETLESIGLKDIRSEFPDMYKELLLYRNNHWMTKIVPMLETKETEFILVGALHLPGKKGLIRQLQKKGFKVKKVK